VLLLSACATSGPVTSEAPAPGALRLLVVRHGEAYSNVPHPADMPRERLDSLTTKGIAQATAAGAFLKKHPVVAVVVSPTGRTRQTGAIIAEQIGLPRVTAEEAAFAGMKEGRTPEGQVASWSWRLAQWKAGRDARPVGGESLEDAATRALRAVERLAAQHPGKAIVVVTHSDVCAALIGHATGTPMAQRPDKHTVPTASVSEIIVSPDGAWKLVKQGELPGS
jgi:probable phosphoglycerate mutase